MPMTGKRRKATALLVVFFVLFSALYLSMGMENGGTESGSAASVVTWRSERFSVTEQVNVEELSGVRSLMLRLFPGMRRHAEEKESGTLTVTLEFLCVLYFLLRLRFIRMTGKQAEACISLKEAVIRYIHRQDGQKDKSGHKTEKNQLFYEKMTGGYTYGNKHFCRSSDRDCCCGNRICCLA